jgi:predicted nuclease of predicted toxin-antitoxin system
VRLLLDEHLSPRRVGGRLTAEGHDVLAIAAVPAYAGLPDEQVLELAAAEERVLITRNAKDFDRITRAWASRERRHAGVLLVWTRETDEFGSLVADILETLENVGAQGAWADLVLSI